MRRRITAFLLSAVMIFSCFVCLGASGDTTFGDMTVEQQYEALMAMEDESEAQSAYNSLMEEQQAALQEYANQMAEAENENAVAAETVVATDAAPFLPAVTVQRTSVRRVLMAARSSAASSSTAAQNENVVTNKTATANSDGSYNIKIEAYATGSVTTVTSTTPVDIVLVLDQSGSMAYDFEGNDTYDTESMRQYAMKQAVKSFVDSVQAQYSSESDHRMAIVTYEDADYTKTLVGWTNVNSTGASSIKSKIDALTDDPSGGTHTDKGMELANELINGTGYSYSGSNTTRQKVVILFTDGVPGDSGFSTSIATETIKTAKAMKDAGVTVYSVGIFAGANPDELYGASGFDTNSNGTVGSKWSLKEFDFFPDLPEADIPAGNRFLNYISSNYTNSTEIGLSRSEDGLGILYLKVAYKITKNFDRSATGYYLTADSADDLNNIFQSISQNIGSTSVTLDSTAVVKDVVTKYFDMPDDASEISVKTYACTGKSGENYTFENEGTSLANAVTIDKDNNTVNVTGFDFKANYVRDKQVDGSYGSKLVIEFTVTPKAAFAGGNDVPTNGESSGIYASADDAAANTNAIENFVVPTINVPINPAVLTAKDANVYYMGDVPAASGMCVNYNTSSDMYKFVKVDYSTDKSVSNTEDGSYTVTATVSPKTDGTTSVGTPATAVTKTATANINVFTPVITYKDSQIEGGTVPDYETQNLVSVVWMHGDEAASGMYGTAPTLSYTYTPAAAALYEETNVDVKIFIGESEVTEACTFKHENCEYADCAYDAAEGKFMVHLSTTSLTIQKHASKLFSENDMFVFTVKDETTGETIKVSLKAGDSVKIKNLCVGHTYTVTEDTNWSWRYTPDEQSKSIKLTADEAENVVSVTNTLTNNKWIGDSSYAINRCVESTIKNVIDTLFGN